MAVDADGAVVAMTARPLNSMRDGSRHEQQPASWWAASAACLREITATLGSARVSTIAGIAVDATSGTILLTDANLCSLTPALMYDDGRARAEAARANEVGSGLWKQMSYRMQPSWALPKLLWLLHSCSIPKGARLMHQNDFVNARLAGKALATDSSHSLKTGYDLIRSEWPAAIMQALAVPVDLLPEVVSPGIRIGEVGIEASRETGLPKGVGIFAGMTDGCAAQIASGATAEGCWNTVIGTTLVVKGTTRELLQDPLGVVYSHRSADGLWLPGGASSTGASAITREFAASELDALNRSAAESASTPLVVYPLVGKGERFPFAAPAAEGFTLGSARSVEEKYCGVLQGIALMERLSFDWLRHLGASTSGRFTISGGAVKSEALNQMRADILERELYVPAVTEGAYGMAVLAASAGSSLQQATERMVRLDRKISPRLPFSRFADQYEALVEELERREWIPTELSVAAARGACA